MRLRYCIGVSAMMGLGAGLAWHDWLMVALYAVSATWGLWPTATKLNEQANVRRYEIPPAVAEAALERAEAEWQHARVVDAALSNGGHRSRHDAPQG